MLKGAYMSNLVDRGILLLDKPETLESMRCVEKAKAILRARKAGHSGTLDPKVTGLMLIAFNEATKAMPLLIGLKKRYRGTMRLHGDVKPSALRQAASAFKGRITQLPPRRSAVARRPREREVFSFRITKTVGRNISFETETEAGTYVRKLCHDIGEKLGIGVHMTSLMRLSVGPFTIKEAHTLEELKEKGESLLIPLEDALKRAGTKAIMIKKEAEKPVRNGSPIHKEFLARKPNLKEGERAVIYSGKTLIGIALVKDGKIKTDRIFNL
jgi:H/ACA ribonucleoprotein complex subunit 4